MAMNAAAPVIFIMGPTASGKTDLAVSLAERLPCDLISVDSALVYRGMDIGTAKPGPDVLARAPHRLIDILDPSEAYSAARFREDALREIAAIQAQGRIAVLVGGTGLYFRALEQGLSPLPEADPATRRRLADEAGRLGWEAMYTRLAEVDPPSAARIHPNDPQRLQRALEVYELSGRALSDWLADSPPQPAFPYPVIKLIIAPADRTYLHQRIAQRFSLMLEQGLIAEVEALYQRGDLHPGLPSIRCVGYRQVWSYLEGEWDYPTMAERGVVATRQLAKRQFTWLRSEGRAHWLDSQRGAQKVLNEGLKILSKRAIN